MELKDYGRGVPLSMLRWTRTVVGARHWAKLLADEARGSQQREAYVAFELRA